MNLPMAGKRKPSCFLLLKEKADVMNQYIGNGQNLLFDLFSS